MLLSPPPHIPLATHGKGEVPVKVIMSVIRSVNGHDSPLTKHTPSEGQALVSGRRGWGGLAFMTWSEAGRDGGGGVYDVVRGNRGRELAFITWGRAWGG